MTVISDPSGASVFREDRERGTNRYLGIAPVTLVLEPGEERLLRLIRRDCKDRRVIVRADEYMPTGLSEKWRHLLYGGEVTARPVRLETTLTAALSVMVYPKGAEVYLDGRLLGRAPLHRTELAPGTGVLRVVSPGFFTKEEKVALVAGAETAANITLEDKWGALYRKRIAEAPGEMTNYAELAHEYIMRGKWAEAEGVLREGFEAACRPGAREQARYFEHVRRTYVRYYIYPAEGADESLRPACREIVEQALEKKLYNAKALQSFLKQMDAYDRQHPPKKK